MTAPALPSLTSLRAALQAATPGPWVSESGMIGGAGTDVHGRPVVVDYVATVHDDKPGDAAFIVAARNAMPALLAIVEAAGDERLAHCRYRSRQRPRCGDCPECRLFDALAALEGSDGE